jgi:polyisoprenoid-binding protein YceI
VTTTETTAKVSRYLLDQSASVFTVRVIPTGMLASFGHSPTLAIRGLSGEARFSPDRPDDASLALRVRADSLEVIDDIKSSDRREIEETTKQSVLQTDKYPEIAFESTRVAVKQVSQGRYQANIDGNLALHGVTQAVSVPSQVVVSGDTLRASGEFTISQKQFEIKPVKVAAGALTLKDELKFKFDIVARTQE